MHARSARLVQALALGLAATLALAGCTADRDDANGPTDDDDDAFDAEDDGFGDDADVDTGNPGDGATGGDGGLY